MSSPPDDARIIRSNGQSLRVVFSLLAVILVVSILLVDSFLHRQRDTQMCEMSYSRPVFVPLAPGPTSRIRDKYTLYLYREGIIDNMHELEGTPALFIPGHAGSYKQARSIAAEAAYYHQNHPQSARFNFFTVDLNEEFSALSGQLLFDQAEFLNDAIAFIQQMYARPAPVLVVGHSMGGVVARLMFTLPNYRQGSIDTVLTLATPHAMAPITIDPKLFKVYSTITKYWRERRQTLENVTLFSIAGGTLDSVVNSDAASVSQIVPRSHGFTVFSTSIPNVWTGCDHMAILWCNQLVKVVAASLAESLRKDHRNSLDARINVFESYIISRPILSESRELSYPENVTTIGHNEKSLSLYWSKQNETIFRTLTVPTSHTDTLKVLSSVDVLKDNKFIVLLCQQRSKCIDASSLAVQLPASMTPHQKVSFIELEKSLLDGYDTLGILQKSDPTSGYLLVENSARSHIEIGNNLLEIALKGVAINLPLSMHTHISVPSVFHPALALRVHVSVPATQKFKPILQQTLGDQGESKYFVVNGNSTLDISFHADPTPNPTKYLHLHVWRQGPMQLHVKIDWYGSLGKSLLRYGPCIVIYTFAANLAIASYQMETFLKSGNYISLPAALTHCLKRRLPILMGIGSAAQLLATDSSPFSKLALGYQGPMWWLFAASFCLSIGFLTVLWVATVVLLHTAKFIVTPALPLANVYVLTATMVALIRVLPVPVIVVSLYLYWLIVTASTLLQERWNEYQCQQSILLLLTTLLPYNVPALVVFIRDIAAVGWSGRVITLSAALDDIPMLAAFLFWIIVGHQVYIPRWMPATLHFTVLYYIVFGVQIPYPIQALATQI